MPKRYPPRAVLVGALRPTFWVLLHPRLSPPVARRLMDAAASGAALPRQTTVEKITLGARPAERVSTQPPSAQPPNTQQPSAVLYLHGGGYTLGSLKTHRALTASLARASQATVFSLDYRLAPEHPYPAALDDAVAAFVDLVRVYGYDPAQLAIAGDSAGGGLSVATARRVIDEYGMTPGALVLFSPWTDPSDDDFAFSRDIVVNRAWGHLSASRYRGTADPQTPGYAPMHGDVTGLPPTLIHLGSREMLQPQIARFASKLRSAGVAVEYLEYPLLWHAGQTQVGLDRTAATSLKAAGAFIAARLTPQTSSS